MSGDCQPGLHTKVLQRQMHEITRKAILLKDRLLGIAVDSHQIIIGNAQEVEDGQSTDILNHVGIVALTIVTRIIVIRIRGHLIAQIIASIDFRHRQVFTGMTKSGEIIVIIKQGRARS